MTDHSELERVAEMAVEKTFTRLGIDITTADATIAAQHDFAFIRSLRYTMRGLRMAIITTVVGGVGTLIWHAMKAIAAD